MDERYKELFDFKDDEGEALKRLGDIISILRKECPWDREQTHESLITCMIEEAYEAVDAIQENNVENLREELGDVLLQVVFHSNLSTEEGAFTLTDVINEECDKMIRRHPHVFLKEKVKTIDKMLEKWENVKSREHGERNYTERLERVPKAFPALLRSSKVQSKASKVGFDWNDVEKVFEKVEKKLLELKEACFQGYSGDISEELGDLLFSVVNLSRFLDVDAEKSLNEATAKFIKRFAYIENASTKRGIDLKDMSLEEMDELWEEAKNKLYTIKEDLQ